MLTTDNCWNCLHYLEWTTFQQIWANSGVTHTTVEDTIMQLIAFTTGIGYETPRFWGLVNTLGFVKTETGFPPPLDVIWYGASDLYWKISEMEDEQGAADWDKCYFWKLPGNQGGAWPTRWPTD